MGTGKSLLGAAFLVVGVTACTAPDRRIAPFADRWAAAQFAEAEHAIDVLIADECGAELQVVVASRGLDESIDAGDGDTFLFLLEKAMTRLANGDLDAAIDLLRRSRDVLAARYQASDIKGWLESGIGDDTFLEYHGADYEHVLTPALLALIELLNGGQDAFAYALQVGEVQERILGSDFGEDVDGKGHGYNPRKQYHRVPIGAYIEGLVREHDGFSGEALKAYERAREWGGPVPVVQEACERMARGAYAQPGHGVVHVFRLAGRGPRLVQGTSPLTEQALLLATIGSVVIGKNVGVFGQASIPIPVVAPSGQGLPELDVRVAGRLAASTSTILDVEAVAQQQVEANLPWILARAAIRRGVKAVAAKAAQDAANRNQNNQNMGLLAGALANLVLTAGEHADTRNWTALPARVQAARFELPEGESELELGAGTLVPLRIKAGSDSYVLVIQPDLAQPGVVLTDVYSQVAAPPAAPALPEANDITDESRPPVEAVP